MEYRTKEMLISVQANIIEASLHSHIEKVSLEGAKENVAIFREITNNDFEEKGLINWVPSFYVTKDIIRYYNDDLNQLRINLIAIVITSFPSRFVANSLVKIRERTTMNKEKTIKIFDSKAAAIDWREKELSLVAS